MIIRVKNKKYRDEETEVVDVIKYNKNEIKITNNDLVL